MASPANSTNEDGLKAEEQITFRFCRNCSNLLYPEENKHERKLIYRCRTCVYHEDATSQCVYRRQYMQAAGETAGVTQDLGHDPTLPRSNRICPVCGEQDNVFFQSQQRKEDTGMKLFYVCVNCGKVFDQESSRQG